VTVGAGPQNPAFDGSNLWVPSDPANSVTVVRASTGAVLQTLTAIGLAAPVTAVFDGQRVHWSRTMTRTPCRSGNGGPVDHRDILDRHWIHPYGACGDGINFWIALTGQSRLARF
jgi:hypothetical protein